MIRFGCMLVALGTIAHLLSSIAPRPMLAVTLTLLIAGVVLLIAGREPWPRCCAHCPVYSRRRAAALEGEREATAIVAAAREIEQARDTGEGRAAALVDAIRADTSLAYRVASPARFTHAGLYTHDTGPQDRAELGCEPLEAVHARARHARRAHRP